MGRLTRMINIVGGGEGEEGVNNKRQSPRSFSRRWEDEVPMMRVNKASRLCLWDFLHWNGGLKKNNTTNDTDLQHLYDPASFTYIICKIYTDLLSLESKQPQGFWSKKASKCWKICPKGFSRIHSDFSARPSVEHAYLGNKVRALLNCSVDFQSQCKQTAIS